MFLKSLTPLKTLNNIINLMKMIWFYEKSHILYKQDDQIINVIMQKSI